MTFSLIVSFKITSIYNCTIHLLRPQIRFYNCRNCDQLHVHVTICHALCTMQLTRMRKVVARKIGVL